MQKDIPKSEILSLKQTDEELLLSPHGLSRETTVRLGLPSMADDNSVRLRKGVHIPENDQTRHILVEGTVPGATHEIFKTIGSVRHNNFLAQANGIFQSRNGELAVIPRGSTFFAYQPDQLERLDDNPELADLIFSVRALEDTLRRRRN
jgi:hypothetical protein